MKTAILLFSIWVATVAPAAQSDGLPLPPDVHQVGALLSDTYSGETILLAKITGDIELDGRLYVEARDRDHWDVVTVAHVFGSYILIKEKLQRDKLIGARIYQ